ncbi:MAG: Rieske 2Fe-2S domain-containing protein [Deltaproteobacteria bacterium]|nr:Rieske 2Fe-2S domain-containing protein [Deltaproteobacteria bacterium]
MKPRLVTFGKSLPTTDTVLDGPDWKQANPRKIERALERALAKPSGGWYVLDAARRITSKPRCFRVADRALVAWRDQRGNLKVGPNECPHMQASLADGHVRDGKIVCPWHALALGDKKHGSWRPMTCHDDGVLAWVRLDDLYEPDELTETPFLTVRPQRFIDGVIRVEANCEPKDVIANRLDPWHGAHFHPYAFGSLKVVDLDDDSITVRVAKKVLGPLAIEVDARFDCPDPRTIVMTITAGEGAGSVVETHATPLGPGRTAIIEATLASSRRVQFKMAELAKPLMRPLIERMAAKLWVDDAAYAERLYEIRRSRRGPHLADE